MNQASCRSEARRITCTLDRKDRCAVVHGARTIYLPQHIPAERARALLVRGSDYVELSRILRRADDDVAPDEDSRARARHISARSAGMC